MVEFDGPVSIKAEEREELLDLLNLVFRSDGGDMGHDYPRHLGLNNRDNIRVIKMSGRIVSHVATTVRPVNLGGIQTKVAGIGAVATHPEARGHRLASLLMKDAILRSVQQGADIMLISGDEGIYRRLHAVECGRFKHVVVGKESVALFPGYSIQPMNKNDIEAAITLRKLLAVRYLLPREDIEALLQCRIVMDKPSDWWMVHHQGKAVGFGVIHVENDAIHVLDWAGSCEALQAATRLWMDHYGIEKMHYTAAYESLIPATWQSQIHPPKPFEGTVLVINAKRFLQRAGAFVCERLGERVMDRLGIEAGEQRVSFKYDNETIEFQKGGELANLFFGHPNYDIIGDRANGKETIAHVLKKAFPLPLVWYGLGYV